MAKYLSPINSVDALNSEAASIVAASTAAVMQFRDWVDQERHFIRTSMSQTHIAIRDSRELLRSLDRYTEGGQRHAQIGKHRD